MRSWNGSKGRELEHKSDDELKELKELGVFMGKKMRLTGDLLALCKHLKGGCSSGGGQGLFPRSK